MVSPRGEIRVALPHGAEGGFDPHQRYCDMTEDNYFEYLHGPILRPVDGDWVRVVGAGSGCLCVVKRALLLPLPLLLSCLMLVLLSLLMFGPLASRACWVAQLHGMFLKAFGTEKVDRFGQVQCLPSL